MTYKKLILLLSIFSIMNTIHGSDPELGYIDIPVFAS